MSPIVSQLTFALPGNCYSVGAGDLMGSVPGAAGTRYFEPDGVAFCSGVLQQSAMKPRLSSKVGWTKSSSADTKTLLRVHCPGCLRTSLCLSSW